MFDGQALLSIHWIRPVELYLLLESEHQIMHSQTELRERC